MRNKILLFGFLTIIIFEIVFYFSIDDSNDLIYELKQLNSIQKKPGRIEPMPDLLALKRFHFSDWDNDIFSSIQTRIENQCEPLEKCQIKLKRPKSTLNKN